MPINAKVPPARVARTVEAARHYLYRLHQKLAPPEVAMMELILAGWTSQAVTVAADLGLADALADGPLPIDELARTVDPHPGALQRLLPALISRGVFRQRRDGRYELTPMAATLRRDARASMAGAARFYGSRQHREHWSMLTSSVRTGKPGIPALRGMDFFEYANVEPEFAYIDNRPKPREIVCRYQGRPSSNTSSTTGAMTTRCRFCVTFARRQDPPTVLLMEFVMPRHNREFLGKWLDLEMLNGGSARERTEDQYRRLLDQAGWDVTRVVPTASPFSVVEARAKYAPP